MSGANLQEMEPAVRGLPLRLEAGQDTAEYVLLIILFALAFTAGFVVWRQSVNDSYDSDEDCVAWSAAEAPTSGTLPADEVGEPDDSSGQEDRLRRRCPPSP